KEVRQRNEGRFSTSRTAIQRSLSEGRRWPRLAKENGSRNTTLPVRAALLPRLSDSGAGKYAMRTAGNSQLRRRPKAQAVSLRTAPPAVNYRKVRVIPPAPAAPTVPESNG